MASVDGHHGGVGEDSPTPWWKTRGGIVLCGFALIAGFYLLTEHTAHVFGALPYLLLLACPLMHLFMHHGHKGHGGHGNQQNPPNRDQGGTT